MAIDFGTKRVGLAVTDPSGIIAAGLGTVRANEIYEFLKNYFLKEPVEYVVVGDPIGLDGKATDATVHVNAFLKNFRRFFPSLRVERMDERFTSVMAKKSMLESGMKRSSRRNKEMVDEISATILLQSWLEKPGVKKSV